MTTAGSTNKQSSWSTHTTITPLLDKYDGFILDQFGVMHNGQHALEGAPEAVQTLFQANKKVIILSNSSSLAVDTLKKLPKLGFDPAHFQGGAVTSGQEAALYVKQHLQHKKALFLTWKEPKTPSPQIFLDQCGDVTVTTNVDQADFILLHGSEVLRGDSNGGRPLIDSNDDSPTNNSNNNGKTPAVTNTTSIISEQPLQFFDTGDLTAVIDPLLQQCLQRQLPMVCANPDFIYVKPDGTTGHMPGTIAKRYQELGSGGNRSISVTSFGKPHKEHFEACVHALGLPKHKVIHIGDSLHHDIAGANAAGIASVLIMGGVHRDEVKCGLGELPSDEVLSKLFATHGGETPTYVVPMLQVTEHHHSSNKE